MFKKLRYTIWCLALCITEELEPPQCESINPNVHPDCKTGLCGCQYCTTPSGHPDKHFNNATGVSWD